MIEALFFIFLKNIILLFNAALISLEILGDLAQFA
jgi:hypothetical protein